MSKIIKIAGISVRSNFNILPWIPKTFASSICLVNRFLMLSFSAIDLRYLSKVSPFLVLSSSFSADNLATSSSNFLNSGLSGNMQHIKIVYFKTSIHLSFLMGYFLIWFEWHTCARIWIGRTRYIIIFFCFRLRRFIFTGWKCFKYVWYMTCMDLLRSNQRWFFPR